MIRAWTADQPDIRGLLLAGSWAHNRARMDSDVDLILVCEQPERYAGDGSWLCSPIPDAVLMDARAWGALTELRFILRSRLEIDIAIAPLSWAGTDAIDDTARAVVADGVAILHDPAGMLAQLVATIGSRLPVRS